MSFRKPINRQRSTLFGGDRGGDDDESAISDADPDDIAKMLKDVDDIEGGLFKKKPLLSPTRSSKQATFSSSKTKNSSFNDDPLGDFDELIGTVKSSGGAAANKSALLNESQQRPAGANNTRPVSITFDESFTFGGGESRTNAPAAAAATNKPSSALNANKSSLVDELFGSTSVDKTNHTSSIEFRLNDTTYNNMMSTGASSSAGGPLSSKSKTPTTTSSNDTRGGGGSGGGGGDDYEHETTFSSGYVPTAVKSTPTSGAKRTVAFDQLFGGDVNSNNDNLFLTSEKPPLAMSTQKFQQHTQQQQSHNDMDDWLKPPVAAAKSSKPSAAPAPAAKSNSFMVSTTSGGPKDSINSSFAESIVDIHVETQHKKQSHLALPTQHHDVEDAWLSNLMSGNNNNNNNNKSKSTPPAVQQHSLAPPVPSGRKTSSIGDTHHQHAANSRAPDSGNDSFADSLGLNSRGLLNKQRPATSAGTTGAHGGAGSMRNSAAADESSQHQQATLQKIKQLEYENQELRMQLEHNKSHYELQLQLMQESCENRLGLMREARDTSLAHFQEAKRLLQDHIELVESEKREIADVYKRKLEQVRRDYEQDMERMRDIQRDAVEKLKEEHADTLRRVKELKESEVDAAMSASSHTRTMETVIGLIEDNAKNLDGISQRVHATHVTNKSEQELMLKGKEEQLRVHEQRLMKQQAEYENEIRVLNETVQRLENHLAEQTKQMAEERWKSKQQEKRTEALQEALLGEQRMAMEKLARERADIDRAKDDILAEQKRLMQQVYEEKRRMAEERIQLDATLAMYKDKQHKDSLSSINMEADLSVTSRRVAEEKQRLEQAAQRLKEFEEQVRAERQQTDDRRRELDTKYAKLEQMAFHLNQKQTQAEELLAKASRERDEQARLADQANSVKASHETRLSQIQQQLALLAERESMVNQEKMLVYKQHQELEMIKANLTCSKCKEPVGSKTAATNQHNLQQQQNTALLQTVGGGGSTLFATSGLGTLMQTDLLSPSITRLLVTNSNNHNQNHNNSSTNNYLNQTYMSMTSSASSALDLDDARMFRQLRIQTMRDKQFIKEEKEFIETLRSNGGGNGANNRSFSMNRLNELTA